MIISRIIEIWISQFYDNFEFDIFQEIINKRININKHFMIFQINKCLLFLLYP